MGDTESTPIRPVRELKGFEKVFLAPGEEKEVAFTLGKRAFDYLNTHLHDWHVETGDFTIEIGASSRDIVLRAEVRVNSTVELPRHYDENSIFMDLLADPRAKAALKPMLDAMAQNFAPSEETSDAAKEAINDEMNLAMLNYMPLRAMISFGGATGEQIEQILNLLNG